LPWNHEAEEDDMIHIGRRHVLQDSLDVDDLPARRYGKEKEAAR
jgi:hypothetical protein